MKMYLICGDRDWEDRLAVRKVIDTFKQDDVVIHGDARGADRFADQEARIVELIVIPVPAMWEDYGKSAGPRRNQMMLEMRPDAVIYFHDDLDSSRGTKDMVLRARSAGIPTYSHTDWLAEKAKEAKSRD